MSARTSRNLSSPPSFLERQKDFAIIVSRLVLRFDVDRAALSAVLTRFEVPARAIMRVIKTKACRFVWQGRVGDHFPYADSRQGRARIIEGTVDLYVAG